MVWINKDAWEYLNKDKQVKLFDDIEIKTYKDRFFYKFGELFMGLVGEEFMCYENDKIVSKKIKEVKLDYEVVNGGKRNYNPIGIKNIDDSEYGYKLIVNVISEDDIEYNFNDIYLK